MGITTDQFLARLKRRITIPASDVLLTDDNILEMADSVLRERIVPSILAVNQNYFVYQEEVPLVANQKQYNIPERAVGRGIREIKLKLNSDSDDSAVNSLTLISLEDEHLYARGGVPEGFYFQGDKIMLVPRPLGTAYSILIWYDLQHGQLVQTSAASQVVSVASNVVTVNAVPSTFAITSEVDFIQAKAGNSLLAKDKAITNIAGTDITFASADDIPTDLVAGDYIALAKQTPVLQIPAECEPLLETWTGERVLYSVGDFEGAQLLASRSVQTEKNMQSILSPRSEGALTKIVNRVGLLKGRGFGGRNRQRGGYYS